MVLRLSGIGAIFTAMVERPDIELSRERGEWIELPKGPLDKPRTLLFGMIVFGGMTLLSLVMSVVTEKPLFTFTAIPPAVLLGVAIAGRFPAAFFRRDRN